MSRRQISVIAIHEDKNLIYDSLKEAAKAYGIYPSSLCNYIKSGKMFEKQKVFFDYLYEGKLDNID